MLKIIEIRQGDHAMIGNEHPDNLLIVAKAKMRRYHQEHDADMLAREARNFQPGSFRTALNQVVNFFKRLASKFEKSSGRKSSPSAVRPSCDLPTQDGKLAGN